MSIEWMKSTPISTWSQSKLQNVYQLLLETTGESYSPERLRMLPLDETFGSWILQERGSSNVSGVLWAMKLSDVCCRVLAFSVTSKLQGEGYGSRGWDLFEKSAKKFGCGKIQLEVRQDNSVAIGIYQRRGLKPAGRITGYYGGNDGWLMLGPVR